MRKFLCLAPLIPAALCVPALAESPGAGLTPYTWDTLATVGGATTATLLIVQYLKAPLDHWRHIPTRILALLIAFSILAAARAHTAGLNWRDVPLVVVNAFVVALAAMGAYELSFAKFEEPESEKPPRRNPKPPARS